MISLRVIAERFGWREGTPETALAECRSAALRIPGVELAGAGEPYAAETLLLLGRRELSYLERLDPPLRGLRLGALFAAGASGLLVCDGLAAPGWLAAAATAAARPLYLSESPLETAFHAVTDLVEELGAPQKSIPGTMLEVYGLGILLLGEAGIGKSECALELVKRGHKLVSDDVVTLRLARGGSVLAASDEIIRYHMEIRGIGIVDVRALFGIGAVLESKAVDLVIQLRKTRESSEFERIGVAEQRYRIFDAALQKLVIPVKVGRNISIQVEVAALNEKLKRHGMHSARNFLDSLYSSLQGRPVA